MGLEMRQLVSFVEVAERRSFTAAAERLHLVQSAVSQHVRQLEHQLGLELLTRVGGVRPTAAGLLVLERARRILAEVESIKVDAAELKGLVAGSVRVGSLQWFGPFDLAGLLADYVRRWPDVELILHEDSSRHMMLDLGHDELDVAFVSTTNGDVPEGLEFLRLAKEELVITAPANLRPSRAKTAPLAALDGKPFVAFAAGLGLRDTVDQALRKAQSRPHVVMESNLPGMIRALVVGGVGASVVPLSVVTAPGPKLRAWSIEPEPMYRELGMAWATGRPLPPAAVALRDLAVASARTLGAA